MVSFNCEGCNDVIKKPKLDQHFYKCHAPVTCLDCNTQFEQPSDWKSHTTCISEAQKYEKSVYRGDKKAKGKKVEKEKSAAKTENNEVMLVNAAEEVKESEEVRPIQEKGEKKEKKVQKDKKRKAEGAEIAEIEAVEIPSEDHKKAKVEVAAPSPKRDAAATSSSHKPISSSIPTARDPLKKKKGDKYKAEKEKRLAKRQAAALGQTGVTSSTNAIPIKAKKWPKDADTPMTDAKKFGEAPSNGSVVVEKGVTETKGQKSKKVLKEEAKAERKRMKKMKRAEKKKNLADKLPSVSAADREIIEQESQVENSEARAAKVVPAELYQASMAKDNKKPEQAKTVEKNEVEEEQKKMDLKEEKKKAKKDEASKEKKVKKTKVTADEETEEKPQEGGGLPSEKKKRKAKDASEVEVSATVSAVDEASGKEKKSKKKSKPKSTKGEESKV